MFDNHIYMYYVLYVVTPVAPCLIDNVDMSVIKKFRFTFLDHVVIKLKHFLVLLVHAFDDQISIFQKFILIAVSKLIRSTSLRFLASNSALPVCATRGRSKNFKTCGRGPGAK